MIKEFSKKVLFVPRSWLNSVARWIQGVHSPDGTIRIKNTVNPGEDGSIELEVNLDRIIAEVSRRFGLESQLDRNSVRDIVWDMVDGASVIVDGRRVSVNKEWLDQYVQQKFASVEGVKLQEKAVDTSTDGQSYDISDAALLSMKSPADLTINTGTENTNDRIYRIGSSTRAAREDHKHLLPVATVNPNADGTPTPGTSDRVARGDHVHPLNIGTSATTYAAGNHTHTGMLTNTSTEFVNAKMSAQNALTTANSAYSKAQDAETAAGNAASTATSANTHANTALSNANTANSNAQSALSNANTANSNAQSALSNANTANSNAQAALTKANTANSNAQAAMTKANTANSNAQEALTKANQAIAALGGVSNVDISSLQTQVQTNTSSITSLQGDVDSAQTSIETIEGDVQTLQTDVQTLQTDVQTLQTDVQTVKADTEQLETTLNDAVEEFNDTGENIIENASYIAKLIEDWYATAPVPQNGAVATGGTQKIPTALVESNRDNLKADSDGSDGKGAIGSSNKLCYSDHVHPLSYPVAPASPTDLGGGVESGMENHGTTAGSSGKDKNGMTFLVATAFGDGGASGKLWFRSITVSKDGRIVSVSAAKESIEINTDI